LESLLIGVIDDPCLEQLRLAADDV